MSNDFDKIFSPYKSLSALEKARLSLQQGKAEKALGLANNNQGDESLIAALVDFYTSSYQAPKFWINSFDNYSKFFVADSETGLIHVLAQEMPQTTISQAKIVCKEQPVDKAVRLLWGRFENPHKWMSHCPACLPKAPPESGVCDQVAWKRCFADQLHLNFKNSLSNKVNSAARRAELNYQVDHLMANKKESIQIIIGEDNYDYFADNLGKAPEQFIGRSDWRKLLRENHRRARHVLIEMLENA